MSSSSLVHKRAFPAMAVNAELLRRIETITQQKQGVGALVQSAIAVYDDHQLVQQLEAVRGRKLHLDLDNFVLFTRAASNLAISETEAKTIYIDNLYSAENVMDRWDSVVRIIRRRIFLIFVAREIAANEAFLTQRAFSPTVRNFYTKSHSAAKIYHKIIYRVFCDLKSTLTELLIAR